MLIFLTLFFTYLCIWIILFLLNSLFSSLYFLVGVCICLFVSYLTIKLKIVNQKTNFLFLQVGFYKYIFSKINTSLLYTIYLTLQFYKKKQNFEEVVDYVYVDNSNLYEVALIVNTLNLLPGVICCALKKQHLVIHSLGFQYFIPSDIFILNDEISNIYDDNVI